METNEKIEEFKTQIKNLEKLLKQPAARNYPIKETIENEIDNYKRELQILECNIEYKDTVGKYYKQTRFDGFAYIFVREIIGEKMICDLIESLDGYQKDIHIYKNTERFCCIKEHLSEITKEEFLKGYKEICDNMVNNAGFGNETM